MEIRKSVSWKTWKREADAKTALVQQGKNLKSRGRWNDRDHRATVSYGFFWNFLKEER